MDFRLGRQLLDRVHRPPVRLTYDRIVDGVVQKVELPFVVGVLADLTGHPKELMQPLRERRFVEINRDNVDTVLAKMKPRLEFRVENTLAGDGSPLAVELHFRRMGDFEPGEVIRQVEPLRLLRAARDQLAEFFTHLDANRRDDPRAGDAPGTSRHEACAREQPPSPEPVGKGCEMPAEPGEPGLLDLILAQLPPPEALDDLERQRLHTVAENSGYFDTFNASLDRSEVESLVVRINDKLTRQLSLILHHPEYHRLEASWRGLHYLVSASETSSSLRIMVLNVKKPELVRDQEKASEFDQSLLYRKVYDYGFVLGGLPFGVLIGDYEFDHSEPDLGLLERLSNVAAAVHAPFIAAASPRLFGCARFAELDPVRDLAQTVATPEHARWHSFRNRLDSRYVGLCLPRILLRQPFGRDTQFVAGFDYHEETGSDPSECYLWGNPAYAFAARLTEAFSRYGECLRIRGVERGGLVSGLPSCRVSTAEEDFTIGPAEIPLSDRHELELSHLGFIPLVNCNSTSDAVFLSVPSCYQVDGSEKTAKDRLATRELAVKLSDLLLVSRFAHYVRVMTNFWDVREMTPDARKMFLNRWIADYVITDLPAIGEPEAWRPLNGARIDVIERSDTGSCKVVCFLRHRDLPVESATLRVDIDLRPGIA